MTLDTTRVALHTAPTGLISFIKHFLYHSRKKAKGKPISQLSYDEGLAIVKKFLAYASTHTLSDLQHFTASKVPTPTWVIRQTVVVPDVSTNEAAHYLKKQFEADPQGIELVGGSKWWMLRGRELTGEWIEMKRDKIKRAGKDPDRVILYIHGGAYFFSSLETHRYQIQRHARKLGARAFAPSYRLAPQYPFPCILQDALASYLFLIRPPPGATHAPVLPSQIIISGDSAGAGAALSLLVILRDQGLPLPAGGTLISPWVDLAHSFPSIMEDSSLDYIPEAAFHFRPGIAWPPIKGDGIDVMLEEGGKIETLDEQIQMYCSNKLLAHPLVSPVNQGSLGGLPPLHISGGSGELLRDEIIYIAHKAANPALCPPSSATLATYPSQQEKLDTPYPPTHVHLAIWDGCAHVTPTLSITRPAKFMYRGVANFGLWALTAARKKEEREERHREKKRQQSGDSSKGPSTTTTTPGNSVMGQEFPPALHSVDAALANQEEHDNDSEAESELSSDEDDEEDVPIAELITVTGHEPPFVDNMVRERVSLNGRRRPMEPAEELQACRVDRESVGKVHLGPVRKWQAKRAEWDQKYGKDLEKYRKIRIDDRLEADKDGYLTGALQGERPPLCALAGWKDKKYALEAGESVDETGKKVNLALALWSKTSSMPDEEQVGDKKVEEMAEKMGKKADEE